MNDPVDLESLPPGQTAWISCESGHRTARMHAIGLCADPGAPKIVALACPVCEMTMPVEDGIPIGYQSVKKAEGSA